MGIVILRKTLYVIHTLSDFVRASSARGEVCDIYEYFTTSILGGRGHGTNEMRSSRSSAEPPSYSREERRQHSTLLINRERACVIIKFSIV